MGFKKIILICATAILCCLILISPNFIKEPTVETKPSNDYIMIRLDDNNVAIFNQSTKEFYKIWLSTLRDKEPEITKIILE